MFRSFTLTTITWFALSGLFPVTAAGAPLEPQTSSSKLDLRVPSAHEIQRLTLTDGSTLYGSVESIADDSITFRTFHVPFVQVGVTDRFSIGGGSPILVSLLTGEFGIWITPKLQVISGGRDGRG